VVGPALFCCLLGDVHALENERVWRGKCQRVGGRHGSYLLRSQDTRVLTSRSSHRDGRWTIDVNFYKCFLIVRYCLLLACSDPSYNLLLALSLIHSQVYGTLDFESRYLGKEIVGLFANRLGRSGSAVVLALLTSAFPSFSSKAPLLLACISAMWLVVCFRVVRLLYLTEKKVKTG